MLFRSNLEGQKIIVSGINDNSVYFIHSLSNNKKLVEKNNEYQLFFVEDFNFYILYVTNLSPNEYLISFLEKLAEKNYVHYIMSDFNNEFVIDYLETQMNFDNFDYSIVYNFGETINDTNPYDIQKYKKLKYFFSSVKVDKENTFDWAIDNIDKFLFDIKYGFLFAYFKFGLNNLLQIGRAHV